MRREATTTPSQNLQHLSLMRRVSTLSETTPLPAAISPTTSLASSAHKRAAKSEQPRTTAADLPAVTACNCLHLPCVHCAFEVRTDRRALAQLKRNAVQTARSLQLGGWCRRRRCGSLYGELEGPGDRVTEMQNWLQDYGEAAATASSSTGGEVAALFGKTCTVVGERRFREFK